MADLETLHQQIRACRLCNLAGGRTHAVPGEGAPNASLMFIGEGPGFNEDRQGRPFVGPAGQFLDELLRSIGLDRASVFITNMVKCRPPNNRDPFPGEVQACSAYLDAQIAAIRPRVIVPLGRHALARWFPNQSIGKLRAKPRRFGDVVVFPLYHPAAALHNGGLRATIEEDFAKLGELLREGAPAPAPEPDAQPALGAFGESSPAQPAPAASGVPVHAPEPEPQPPNPGEQQLSMF